MDATVNDFLNEINQISSKDASNEQSEEVWQECYDELTGYSYFWNTETDEVTWVPPKSYKPADNAPKKGNTSKPPMEKAKKKTELFVPPTSLTTPQYSTTSLKPEAKVKVYSIQETIKKPEVKNVKPEVKNVKPEVKNVKPEVKNVKPEVKNVSSFTSSNMKRQSGKRGPFRKPEDSDDEKIELITEYGEDTDSDAEEKTNLTITKQKKNTLKQPAPPVRKVPSPVQTTIAPLKKAVVKSKPVSSRRRDSRSDNDEEDDDDDDIDLLAKIQQRAQELKKLGGEVPPEVKNIIQNSDIKEKGEKPKAVSGFSLVAGYNSGSSDSESENQEALPPKPVFPVAPPLKPVPETSHSTLFPITKPIDLKDFIGAEPPPESEDLKVAENDVASNNFDSKAFQRKRRIGISLVNNIKRPKEDVPMPSTEFAGFGFKTESSKHSEPEKEEAPSIYSGFQKGGVMFVKTNTLNPITSTEEKSIENVDSQDSCINRKETESDYNILREKLLFLGEGREPVLPVQVMLIQAETLFLAMNQGGLKLSYLHKWLKEMCSELVKLEKEAAPEGWLLQWDRSHKRYFYQNQTTGVSQWRYPEPDVTRCDDAMDICTTPPPQDLPNEIGPSLDLSPVSPVMFGPQLPAEPPLPPSPPKIRSPTPPPPPMISMEGSQSVFSDVPLPPEPTLSEPTNLQPPLPPLENGQPLPPGVDLLPDVYNKPKEPEVKTSDTLTTALDSFYSEIAEVVENTNSRSPTSSSQVLETSFEIAPDMSGQQGTEVFKKKKKKVKLAQGLTMKKKGVSQLVEKWKNVQKNYGD